MASNEHSGTAVSTSVGFALMQGLIGGPVIGLPVGAVLAVLQPDTEGWALLIGAIFGPILGFGFGAIGAVAVIVAGAVSATNSLAAAKRRDRIWGTAAIFGAGVIAALWWMSVIDLEGGDRLYEVIVLAIAPPICALAWSFLVGFPHLSQEPPPPASPPAPGTSPVG